MRLCACLHSSLLLPGYLIAFSLLFPLVAAVATNNNPNATIPSTMFNLNMTEPQLKRKDNFVIDSFKNKDRNDLDFWHGPGENLKVHYGKQHKHHYVRLTPTDPDQNYHTQLSAMHCTSLLPFKDRYLHIRFKGTNKFSISLNQNNPECRPGRNPYPSTWDTVEAGRYTYGHDIYIPLSHFNIDHSRVVSVSVHGFYTTEYVDLYKIEIVKHLPHKASVPVKLPNGNMILKCSRPNSFAFGIDDGQPWLAEDIMDILEEEDVLVTFFVVGTGLRNKETNFTNIYKEMLHRGHQIALHSFSHRKMEGLPTEEDIDDDIDDNIDAFDDLLDIESQYFRPPFGTVGARLRQRLAAKIHDPYIVNWSVDVEDWLWAESDTPERQIDAFTRDVMRGGNLAVMHYLNKSTVAYFRQFIHIIKSSGMNIMRIDQCLEDPKAPPLRD